jgi:predicted esterase
MMPSENTAVIHTNEQNPRVYFLRKNRFRFFTMYSVSLKMIKKIFTGCSFILVSLMSSSQPPKPVVLKNSVFSKLTIRKNVLYSENVPAGTRDKYHQFDLYEAANDSAAKRPLIIWMHGGGFKFGSKRAKGIRIWSKSFAQRGYVCAAINYRLSNKNTLRSFTALVKACADAVLDAEQAVAYFKARHAKYRVDTNCIVLAGNSVGAMIALQSAYSNNARLGNLINKNDSNIYAELYNRQNIAAVINFWGAIFNTEWLKNANVPIVSVHGKKDRIVPYANSETLFGSFRIHQAADSLHIPNRLKTYEKYGHELQKHFNPIIRSGATKRRWMEAQQFAADFLFEVLFEKTEGRIQNTGYRVQN